MFGGSFQGFQEGLIISLRVCLTAVECHKGGHHVDCAYNEGGHKCSLLSRAKGGKELRGVEDHRVDPSGLLEKGDGDAGVELGAVLLPER